MYDQPRYEPLERSELLRGRHLVAAAGRRDRAAVRSPRRGQGGDVTVLLTGREGGARPPKLPFPVDRQVLERGQQRYRIFCTPCHGELGDGQGMIVKRGFNPPPPFTSERLLNEPLGHFFEVITHGHGVMYSYASRVPPRDRWAIAAYIRALQLSQHAAASELPAEDREPAQGSRAMSMTQRPRRSPTTRCGHSLDRLQTRALLVGGVGLALCLVGGLIWPGRFFASYLVASSSGSASRWAASG